MNEAIFPTEGGEGVCGTETRGWGMNEWAGDARLGGGVEKVDGEELRRGRGNGEVVFSGVEVEVVGIGNFDGDGDRRRGMAEGRGLLR